MGDNSSGLHFARRSEVSAPEKTLSRIWRGGLGLATWANNLN